MGLSWQLCGRVRHRPLLNGQDHGQLKPKRKQSSIKHMLRLNPLTASTQEYFICWQPSRFWLERELFYAVVSTSPSANCYICSPMQFSSKYSLDFPHSSPHRLAPVNIGKSTSFYFESLYNSGESKPLQAGTSKSRSAHYQCIVLFPKPTQSYHLCFLVPCWNDRRIGF